MSNSNSQNSNNKKKSTQLFRCAYIVRVGEKR